MREPREWRIEVEPMAGGRFSWTATPPAALTFKEMGFASSPEKARKDAAKYVEEYVAHHEIISFTPGADFELRKAVERYVDGQITVQELEGYVR